MSKFFELNSSLDCNDSIDAYRSVCYKGAIGLSVESGNSVATIMLTKDEVMSLIDGLHKLIGEGGV